MAYIGKIPTAAALTSSDISDGIITNAKLAQDIISADTALGATPADTDEFLVSDAGTLKRMDYSYIKGGITVADNWRVNADDAVDAAETDLDTGWEQVDTTGQTNLGSSMTQSSGVFTFPSTGIYFVQLQVYYVHGTGASTARAIIKHFDGSSTYTALSDVRSYAANNNEVVTNSTLFDCQNTSNDKVVFYGGGTVNGNVIAGSTSDNRTAATFIRLGDT